MAEHDDDIRAELKRLYEDLTAGNPNLPVPDFPPISEVIRNATESLHRIFSLGIDCTAF